VAIQVELVEKAERQAAQADRRYQREKQITEDTIKQREDAERRLEDQRKKIAELEKKMEELQSNADVRQVVYFIQEDLLTLFGI